MSRRPVSDDREEPQFGYDRRVEPHFDEPRAPKRNTSIRRRPRSLLPVFMVGAILILFAGFLSISYLKGPKLAPGQLPVITADTTPVKVKPDKPGGAEIPFQNTTVYDDLGKQKHSTEVEHLLAPPEQPLPPASIVEATPPAQPIVTATEPAKPVAVQPAAPQVSPAPADATLPPPPENEAVLAPPEPAAAPAAKPVVQKPKPTVAPTGPRTSIIQLGSFKDEAAAKSEWQRLKTRYSDQLGSFTPAIMQADLGEKGIWYRLRVGPLTAEKAKAICAPLLTAKAPCIVSNR